MSTLNKITIVVLIGLLSALGYLKWRNNSLSAKVDTLNQTVKEKQETIASWEKDKKDFEEMIFRIKNGALRPGIKLKLYPEYSCFMVDCVRHKFIYLETFL